MRDIVTKYCEIDYNGFREFVGQWGGPDLADGFNYVLNSTIVYSYYDISLF